MMGYRNPFILKMKMTAENFAKFIAERNLILNGDFNILPRRPPCYLEVVTPKRDAAYFPDFDLLPEFQHGPMLLGDEIVDIAGHFKGSSFDDLFDAASIWTKEFAFLIVDDSTDIPFVHTKGEYFRNVSFTAPGLCEIVIENGSFTAVPAKGDLCPDGACEAEDMPRHLFTKGGRQWLVNELPTLKVRGIWKNFIEPLMFNKAMRDGFKKDMKRIAMVQPTPEDASDLFALFREFKDARRRIELERAFGKTQHRRLGRTDQVICEAQSIVRRLLVTLGELSPTHKPRTN